MRNALFTISSRNHFHFSRTLASSFAAHHPEFTRIHVIADTRGKGPNDGILPEFDRHIFFDELEIPNPAAFSFRYDIVELNTALKPTVFRRLFAEGYERVIYLDSDIFAYRRFSEVLQVLDEGATSILTPHALTPNLHAESPNDLTFMRAGIYNLGFLALANTKETSELLAWWETRLRYECVGNRLSDGIFVDQKFMDLWPTYCSGTHILRNPAYNVAYWNLDSRTIKKTQEGYTANGLPLAFFHFSGIVSGDRSVLSRHQQRWTPGATPELEKLFADYQNQLEAHRTPEISAAQYGFGAFSDGTDIPSLARIIFRETLEPFEGDPFTLMPDILDRPAGITPNPGGAVTQLAHALWMGRRDLQSAFPLRGAKSQIRFAEWFLTRVAAEAGIASRFTDIVAERLSRLDYGRIELEESPGGSFIARQAFLALRKIQPYTRWLYKIVPRSRREKFLNAIFQRARPTEPPPVLAPGLSLIGYPFLEKGIGEAMRALARAIESTGVDYDVMNFEEQFPSSERDRRLAPRITARPSKRANVFCVNADTLGSDIERAGADILRNRYNIVWPFWELSRIHPQWRENLHRMDEIWAATNFIADAFRAGTARPVVHIPMAVYIPPGIAANRRRYRVPEDATAFLFAFDFSSYPERKNSGAVLQAFVRAFGQDRNRNVSLIIKTMGDSPHKDVILDSIRRMARDDARIIVIDAVLARPDAYNLIMSCDVFVSLHRSEGFGLGIAEAMAMGKAVIATDYSGSRDFVTSDTGFPIPYRLIPVGPEDYPHFMEGQQWADPDIDAAARIMVQLADDRRMMEAAGARAQAYMAVAHSPEAAGKVIASRLQYLQERGHAILKV